MINRKLITKKEVNNILIKPEQEFLKSVQEDKILSKKDIILYIYNSNINFIDSLINKVNDFIKIYRSENITYQIIIYSPFDYKLYVGIDTYNIHDSNYEVRRNGEYTRCSCVHFIDTKENFDKKISKFNPYYLQLVEDNIYEFYE